MQNQFSRTEELIGKQAVEKLQNIKKSCLEKMFAN